MNVVLAASGGSAYWYLTRSTGAVALLLLTLAIVLGVVDVRRWSTPRWPRFIVDSLHRNVSLLAMTFLAVHIITSVLDSFAPISLLDAFVPFAGSYRPFWLGLGARRLRPADRGRRSPACCASASATERGARSTGSRTRAGRSRCCTASAPAATRRRPGCCCSASPACGRRAAGGARRAIDGWPENRGRRRAALGGAGAVLAVSAAVAAGGTARFGMGAPLGHAQLAARPPAHHAATGARRQMSGSASTLDESRRSHRPPSPGCRDCSRGSPSTAAWASTRTCRSTASCHTSAVAAVARRR